MLCGPCYLEARPPASGIAAFEHRIQIGDVGLVGAMLPLVLVGPRLPRQHADRTGQRMVDRGVEVDAARVARLWIDATDQVARIPAAFIKTTQLDPCLIGETIVARLWNEGVILESKSAYLLASQIVILQFLPEKGIDEVDFDARQALGLGLIYDG